MIISKSQTKQRNIFPWGLRGLPALCAHITYMQCACALVCACVKREKSYVWPSCMCRGQRTTSRVGPCLPEALVPLSLVTVYVRSAGIGPAMDSLLSIPSSHKSAETQIDVGVLGIQASSLIFLASALPTETHHQPHKLWSLCKRENTNKEDTERTERQDPIFLSRCTKDPRQGGKIHL